jgi:hypothetical protein
MRRRRRGLLLVVATCLVGTAEAAESPSVDPALPELPALPAPSRGRVREGFFARFAGGPAFTSLEYSTSGSRIRGFGGALNLALGRAMQPGVILAVSMQMASYRDPTLTAYLASENGRDLSLTTFGVAFLFDYYPDPRAGFHFGGELGVGGTVLRDTEADDLSKHDPTGTSWGAHLGYEVWISDQWSVGGLFKLNYLSLWRDRFATPGGIDPEYGLSGFQPLLLASFTHN